MITFFTIPKPFVGHTGIIQRNALQSWRAIPGVEIIIFGNEEGSSDASKEVGAKQFNQISLSPYGTPYLDEVFQTVQRHAENKYLCYVNADILLYPDIITALESVPFRRFLMTGRRAGIAEDFPGMDYFLFPKGMLTEFPPFIVGRRGWDNWLVYHCRKRGIPIIDASGYITAVHQNHDYNHIPEKRGNRWEKCPESDYNLSLVNNRIIYLWELGDATHQFTNGKVVEKPTSLRQVTQGLILRTPERFHRIISPFYRAGHIAKYGFLKVRGYLK